MMSFIAEATEPIPNRSPQDGLSSAAAEAIILSILMMPCIGHASPEEVACPSEGELYPQTFQACGTHE